MQALIIDDSRAMRMILKKNLLEMGFDVSEADNGLTGLDALGQEPRPELVLVDWNMPEMNGYDFVKAVRSKSEYDPVKLVVVSSETQAEGVDRMEEAGADEYLTKPFTKELLAEKLGLLGFPRT
jgi:two-component system chemotaxis response regulator CheY